MSKYLLFHDQIFAQTSKHLLKVANGLIWERGKGKEKLKIARQGRENISGSTPPELRGQWTLEWLQAAG